MKTINTYPDNNPNQTLSRRSRQVKRPDERPDERTTAAGYQKLPHQYRPKAGCDQRDPIDSENHPYPSMKRFAEFLALRFNTSRTGHSYYRQMRLVHEHCGGDPEAKALAKHAWATLECLKTGCCGA